MTDVELVFALLARLRAISRFDSAAVEKALGIRMEAMQLPDGDVARGSLPTIFSIVQTLEVRMYVEGRSGVRVDFADGIDIPESVFVERWGPFRQQGVSPSERDAAD